MPSLATYNQPQVDQRALPGARQDSVASPELLGATGQQNERFGRNAQSAGSDLLGIATDMQTRQNADMVFRAETSLKTEYIAFENEVRQRRGADAYGVAKETADWWDKKSREHSDGLENPVQQYLFNQVAQKLKIPSLDVVSGYEIEQRRASVRESATASIASSANLAAANATNPIAVAIARDDIIKRTQILGKVDGWGADKRDFEIQNNLSTMHTQVIQNLADTDPTSAKAYFEKNKGEVNGGQYDSIDKLLKHAGTLQTAQKAVDALSAMEASEAEGLAQIRGNYEGEERKQAEIMWKERSMEKDKMREQSQKGAADSAWDVYQRTKKISAIPPSVWQAMDGKDRIVMEDRAAKDAEGKPVKTNFSQYYDLTRMAQDEPMKFAGTDLRRYTTVIGEADLERLVGMQGAIKTDAGKGVAEIGTQLTVAHNQMKWGESDKEKKGLFDATVLNTLDQEQQAKGKKLTFEERQKVIDRMMIQGDTNGWLPFGDKRYFEVQGTDRAKDFKVTVPDADKAQITEALHKHGIPVTDDEVLKWYKRKNKIQ